MPDQMFQQTFVSSKQGRKAWHVVASFLGQILVIFVLILIPLIYTDALPRAQLTSFLIAPPPPPPPPPPPQTPKLAKAIPRQFDRNKLMAPKEIPRQIASITEPELPPPSSDGVLGSVSATVSNRPGDALAIFGNAPAAAAPPPPVKDAPKAANPTRIPVGGKVQQANLIRKVQPLYPPLARQARIQGVVHFTAIIGRDGAIQNLQLIDGHPLLVEAARQAVSQWRYKPTLLNSEPVEVVTQIDVNFTLTQ